MGRIITVTANEMERVYDMYGDWTPALIMILLEQQANLQTGGHWRCRPTLLTENDKGARFPVVLSEQQTHSQRVLQVQLDIADILSMWNNGFHAFSFKVPYYLKRITVCRN